MTPTLPPSPALSSHSGREGRTEPPPPPPQLCSLKFGWARARLYSCPLDGEGRTGSGGKLSILILWVLPSLLACVCGGEKWEGAGLRQARCANFFLQAFFTPSPPMVPSREPHGSKPQLLSTAVSSSQVEGQGAEERGAPHHQAALDPP